MAEGLWRARFAAGVGLAAGSAGVAAERGYTSTPEAIVAARELGADLRSHHSRPLEPRLVEEAGLVLTMTAAQAAWLQERFPEGAKKIMSLGQLAQGPKGPDVADPVGGPLEEYRRMARQINALLSQAEEKIRAKIRESN
jgi:protein-tyrosine-phosphatase